MKFEGNYLICPIFKEIKIRKLSNSQFFAKDEYCLTSFRLLY